MATEDPPDNGQPRDDQPLSHAEKVNRFGEALTQLIDYYVMEYGITLAEAVGCLECEKFERLHGSLIGHEEADDGSELEGDDDEWQG